MILTFINNHKLFIQFDRIVKKGSIFITDEKQYSFSKEISDSEFEVIDLSEDLLKLKIRISIGNKQIIRTIKIG